MTPVWPAVASAWTWSPAKCASSAARMDIAFRSRAKGTTFTLRLPQTLAVTQAVFVQDRRNHSTRCRSHRCAASAASPREEHGEARRRQLPLRRRRLRTARPRQPGRRTAPPPRPKASCRCRCCWCARATCASAVADRPGGRQPRNRGEVGRPAAGIGAGHLRRDHHGRRFGGGDPRRCTAGAPPGGAWPRDVVSEFVQVESNSAACRWSWWSTTRSPCARSPVACWSATTSRSSTAKDGLDALERMADTHPRPDAARHRNAAHGRLRAGDRDEGGSAHARWSRSS